MLFIKDKKKKEREKERENDAEAPRRLCEDGDRKLSYAVIS